LIATGNLEIGLREWPAGDTLSSQGLEAFVRERNEFLSARIHREGPAMYSSPLNHRTAGLDGHWTRVGMDYVRGDWRCGPGFFIWGEQPIWLTWPGADGAQPTVRLQMIREGLQDFEARLIIAKRILDLPEQHRTNYRALLNELFDYTGRWFDPVPANRLPHTALSFDWYGYVARIHAAAFEADCTGPMVNGTPADDPSITAAIRAEADSARLLARLSEASAHYRYEAVKRLGALKAPLAEATRQGLEHLLVNDPYEEIRAAAMLALDACDPAGEAGWKAFVTGEFQACYGSDIRYGQPGYREQLERRARLPLLLRALGEKDGVILLSRRWPQAAQDPVQRRALLEVTTALQWRVKPMLADCLAALKQTPTSYFAAVDAASDPATADILVKTYPKDWTLYPTFARNLTPERLLAWIEPIALESAHPEYRGRILSAWRAIGLAALPSMERVRAAMAGRDPAQDKLAASYAEGIAKQIAEMKGEGKTTPPATPPETKEK
jgi:hypothetical protein